MYTFVFVAVNKGGKALSEHEQDPITFTEPTVEEALRELEEYHDVDVSFYDETDWALAKTWDGEVVEYRYTKSLAGLPAQ